MRTGFLIMVLVESAGITDISRKRKGNEDALLLDNEPMLYVAANLEVRHASYAQCC